jgi:hypothetical protein
MGILLSRRPPMDCWYRTESDCMLLTNSSFAVRFLSRSFIPCSRLFQTLFEVDHSALATILSCCCSQSSSGILSASTHYVLRHLDVSTIPIHSYEVVIFKLFCLSAIGWSLRLPTDSAYLTISGFSREISSQHLYLRIKRVRRCRRYDDVVVGIIHGGVDSCWQYWWCWRSCLDYHYICTTNTGWCSRRLPALSFVSTFAHGIFEQHLTCFTLQRRKDSYTFSNVRRVCIPRNSPNSSVQDRQSYNTKPYQTYV